MDVFWSERKCSSPNKRSKGSGGSLHNRVHGFRGRSRNGRNRPAVSDIVWDTEPCCEFVLGDCTVTPCSNRRSDDISSKAGPDVQKGPSTLTACSPLPTNFSEAAGNVICDHSVASRHRSRRHWLSESGIPPPPPPTRNTV